MRCGVGEISQTITAAAASRAPTNDGMNCGQETAIVITSWHEFWRAVHAIVSSASNHRALIGREYLSMPCKYGVLYCTHLLENTSFGIRLLRCSL